jgi:hypothetical protein
VSEKDKKVTAVYDGPRGALNYEVADASGKSAVLEPGCEYRLPAELVERLQASTPYWTVKTRTGQTITVASEPARDTNEEE